MRHRGVDLRIAGANGSAGVVYQKNSMPAERSWEIFVRFPFADLLSNYSSFEGVPYCKAHFEQLFKETGSYNKSFQSQSPAKITPEKLAPELMRSPSKAARMFSGTQDKCATCGKTAYPLEKVTVEEKAYHKSCFKCSHGGCAITPSNYAALEGILYCKHHFSQLFKEKGSYNHLIKCASVKRAEAKAEQPAQPAADSS
ncbi:unnamed protein product [Urochloa decumbens]|uniref:LIM zinc-binding domain-containing protein n=1 Tax=Urochloa decumbens TaxID=240449 RepID=A0ABC8X6X2_9POAL